MDNLLVIMLIFKSFKIPPARQGRVLKWGILGAIVMRATFIFAGMALLDHFAITVYLFGAALFYAAWVSYKEGLHALRKARSKRERGARVSQHARGGGAPAFSAFSGGGGGGGTLRQRGGGTVGGGGAMVGGARAAAGEISDDDEEVDHADGAMMRMLKRVIPFDEGYTGLSFFTRRARDNALQATPLFAALVIVEASDVIFAVRRGPLLLFARVPRLARSPRPPPPPPPPPPPSSRWTPSRAYSA